jgi:hypothetical protein
MKISTVFVMGAGASAPYNFPLGIGLVREVINRLTQHESAELFRNLGFDQDEMHRLASALTRSGRQSVDAFLEHRPEFLEVGKAAIALVLIERELSSTLFEARPGGWLDYLFDRLNCPFERFGKNEVAFITFNYDRSLEFYLFTRLQNSYEKSAEACADQLSQIPIVHLHGDLGALPWHLSPEAIREYDSKVSPEAIKIAASRIKIIHEDIADRDSEFEKAKQLLNEADLIYFLGFGYNSTNMARLGVNNIRDGIAFGTGYNLTEHERYLIMQSVERKIQILPRDCIELLRNVVRW